MYLCGVKPTEQDGYSPMKHTARNSGIVAVVALIFLMVFATLGVSYATFANASFLQANNLADSQVARMSAESGLAFMNYVLDGASVSSGATGQDLLDAVANHVSGVLDDSAILQGGAIHYDGSMVVVPTISHNSSGVSFSAMLVLAGDDKVSLLVTGTHDTIQRTVGVEYALISDPGSLGDPGTPPSASAFFGYGIASRSKIRLTGNASIEGANSVEEGSVLSATFSDDEALKMNGNATVGGDVYFSNTDAYATLTGNISVGGESLWSGGIDDHIHTDTGNVEFPEVDPTVFEPFATNLVDSSTPTKDTTLTNIRIPANTNPTFSGNITIKGVVFIETPNRVKFSGNLNLTGVVVTQDAGDDVYDTNTIKFSGNTSVQGVEALPDTPEFSELREMPGSFLLAPGFGTEFTGNFGTVSGTMAADEFKFSGNAGGTIKGMLINYSDSEFKLTGNANIIIDRDADIERSAGTSSEGTPAVPPGFTVAPTFQIVPSSYLEY